MKSRKKTAAKTPTISKALLLEAAKKGLRWGYNRQLDDVAIARIPDRLYPILGYIEHFHSAGKPVAEHRRLFVNIKGSFSAVDMPVDFFERVVAAA